MVGTGEQAEFSCLHSTTDVIAWKVNGTVVIDSNPPPNITTGMTTDEKGNVATHTMTIVAQSNYNETEIVCVAAYVGDIMPEEETAPVILLVQGNH